MVDKLDEINIVLWCINKLMDVNKCADRNLVIDEYKKNTKEGRMPDYELTIDYSAQLGFVKSASEVLELSINGENYIGLNTEDPHDLSDDQKSFLVRTCFLNGTLRDLARTCLRCFVESSQLGTFVWSEIDNAPLGSTCWIAEQLCQLDVLLRTDDGYEVSMDYVSTIATFLSEPKGWTQEELEEWLKERKELGNFAENVIQKYEKHRLKSAGYIVESYTVRFVGKLKVDVGYDIESFDGKSLNMNYDRFIEVKGSKGAQLRFLWSATEVSVAKKLQDKYWIYFQGGIDMKNKKIRNMPLLFQNPYKIFFIDKKYPISEHGYIVQANIRGELIEG